MNTGWEHFHHDADIGVRGSGPTPQTAFERAAVALSAIITPPDRIREQLEVDIACQAPSLELLFFDFLNELIYEMTTRAVLFGRFEVGIDGKHLTARAFGEPIDRQRHEPVVEPKGATLTDLRVGQNEDGEWIAQCVVDV
jgi:SHS2 domain-containing protein